MGSFEVKLEEDLVQVVGVGVAHLLLWVLLASLLGLTDMTVDPFTFLVSIPLLIALHEGFHAIPLLIWGVKPRFGIKRVKYAMYVYTGVRGHTPLPLRKFVIAVMAPMILQALLVPLYQLLPEYRQLFLSLILLNALGMGGDIYLFALTLGCGYCDTYVVDKGVSLIVKNCKANLKERRNAFYAACYGLCWGFVVSIISSLALLFLAPLTGSIPYLVRVEKTNGFSASVNVTLLLAVLTPLFAFVGYVKKRKNRVKGL